MRSGHSPEPVKPTPRIDALNDAPSRLQVEGTVRGDRHAAKADAGFVCRRTFPRAMSPVWKPWTSFVCLQSPRGVPCLFTLVGQ
jgi:hypothetical protein